METSEEGIQTVAEDSSRGELSVEALRGNVHDERRHSGNVVVQHLIDEHLLRLTSRSGIEDLRVEHQAATCHQTNLDVECLTVHVQREPVLVHRLRAEQDGSTEASIGRKVSRCHGEGKRQLDALVGATVKNVLHLGVKVLPDRVRVGLHTAAIVGLSGQDVNAN